MTPLLEAVVGCWARRLHPPMTPWWDAIVGCWAHRMFGTCDMRDALRDPARTPPLSLFLSLPRSALWQRGAALIVGKIAPWMAMAERGRGHAAPVCLSPPLRNAARRALKGSATCHTTRLISSKDHEWSWVERATRAPPRYGAHGVTAPQPSGLCAPKKSI